jgi:hypothetical protein
MGVHFIPYRKDKIRTLWEKSGQSVTLLLRELMFYCLHFIFTFTLIFIIHKLCSEQDTFLLYTVKDTLDPVERERVREPHAAKYDVNQNISD